MGELKNSGISSGDTVIQTRWPQRSQVGLAENKMQFEEAECWEIGVVNTCC